MFDGRYNIVVLCDWHCPYEDEAALGAAFDFCGRVQPDIVVLHELHDFYAISKFCKDPSRLNTLQMELDVVDLYLRRLRRTCPKARIILLRSNHSDRLRRYLWSTAPALSCLRSLKLEELLRLDKYQVEYMDYFIYQDFLFKHGDLISMDSGMTARRELAREGMSGCSGHTHRLGQVYRHLRGGDYTWMECGCLCLLDPDWYTGIPNWQLGLGIVSFAGPGRKTFFASTIPVIDGEVLL